MPGDEFESLIEQDVRIRKASMIATDGELTDWKRQEILAALLAHMGENGLTQEDVAHGIGRSTTYINNLLNNSKALPAQTRDAILLECNNWLDSEARARANQRPADFIKTRVAERLYALVERLRERPDVAYCFAPAGVGKTTCIRAVVAEIPSTVMVRVNHDCRHPGALLRKIYNTVSRKKRTCATVRLADVVEKLRKPERVATANVLILDQAHELHDKAIKMLVIGLHEEAQCSVLLVGTSDLRVRLSTDDDPEHGQVSSRVGLRIDLAPELHGMAPGGKQVAQCFTVADIRKIFHRSKLKLHSDAARMLADLANTMRGTLRFAIRVFEWAEVAARKSGSGEITVAHLRAAMRLIEAEVEAGLALEPAAEAVG
jgi:Cdc6-like AAA superfamily ATPase